MTGPGSGTCDIAILTLLLVKMVKRTPLRCMLLWVDEP
jgi:hypothetical protein